MHNPAGSAMNPAAQKSKEEFISINREPQTNLAENSSENNYSPGPSKAKGGQRGYGRGGGSVVYGAPKATPTRSYNSVTASSSSTAWTGKSDHVRNKRKREATSGDRVNEVESTKIGHNYEHFNGASTTLTGQAVTTNGVEATVEEMPWHPAGLHQYTKGIIGLHEEIEDFYQWMVPTQHEHYTRLGVVYRVRKAILKRYPACRVDIFGSFRTGLYLPTSDIDLVICGKWEQLPFGDLSEALTGLAQPGSLLVLERAAVPIIKLADDATGIRVDISFNMANGLRAAELIKHFKKRYPALPKLIYVLKQFLYQRDLNEVYSGGLSSYALILMVVSFLQTHVREDARSNKANLGVLLIEFFELYGLHFNYTRTAIKITEEGAYLAKEQAPCYQGGGYGTLCIEDPYDVNNDVGKSSYGFPNCKKTFEQAYFHFLKQFEPKPPQCNLSLLSQIIRVKDDLLKWRADLAKCNIEAELRLDIPPEDPRPPQKMYALPSKDAIPTEIKLGFTYNPPTSSTSPTEISSKNRSDTVKEVSINGHKSPEKTGRNSSPLSSSRNDLTKNFEKNNANGNGSITKESDNMSAVSIGTSSSLSSSSSSAVSSPAASISSSDTDAEAVIISGQATPNSAMSISPATSEICSILDNGNISGKKYNTTTPSKHKIKQSSKKHNRDRENRSQKNSSNHVGVTERSDLDLDWRGTGGTGTGNTTPEIPASAPSSGGGGGQQNSRNYWQKNQKSSSGNGNTSSNVIQINQESKEPSRPLSADEDTNWRDHRNKPLTENNSTWRTIQSKSKNRKIQGKECFEDQKTSENDNQAAKSQLLHLDNESDLNNSSKSSKKNNANNSEKTTNCISNSRLEAPPAASTTASTSATTTTSTGPNKSEKSNDNAGRFGLPSEKKKVKNKHKQRSSGIEAIKSSTSSKDTEATGNTESESNQNGNGNTVNGNSNNNQSPHRRVSRFPGQIKPKR